MLLKINQTRRWIVPILFALLLIGCVQQERFKSNETSPQSNGLGTLCSNKDECISFCTNNRGRCESYCREKELELCTIIFPRDNVSESQSSSYRPAIEKVDKPVIENIGVEIDFYDESTSKAGDFKFDTFTYSWGGVYNNKVFFDYGEKNIRENEVKFNAQPVFIVPLGTKVHALTSGKVIAISKLYSDDYSIQVIKPENPYWIYEHEHVINVLVSVGDNVVAGQVIAEVSDYNKWLKEDGYGVLDIGILTAENTKPWHHCPFMYLDESVKQDYFAKINSLYVAWEKYAGNSSLYEEVYAVPGCIITEPIQG